MTTQADHQMSNLTIDQVLTRGVEQILPSKAGLAKLMKQQKIRLYLGIDPTGAFLHLGHSVPLRKLQQFAELGHEVILLIGNGTVKIGDPTGRDTSRPVLTDQEIEANFQNWKKQASKILDFDQIEIRHNGDWLDKMMLTDFIKLMAKTTVQQLFERDMFQQRLKKNLPIHGHEILYPMLQGYDSVAMDVDLEIGGTDQTFNMMMGRTLQKTYHNKEKWVLTTPLIEGTDGRKMSKSFNNYVALTTPAQEMYGKLMSLKDELILKYFRVLTDVPQAQITAMQQAMKQGENPMRFKKQLAKTITSQYHDAQAANQAEQYFEKTVQNQEFGQAQICKVEEQQNNIVEMLKKGPIKRSKSALRRLAKQGAITVYFKDGQSQKITDPYQVLETDQVDKIKVGKRGFYQVITQSKK
ncbi:MAG: tyrosine--tRNA ligase [Candidatus Pacebacteria bacterium]|nr:tyrosine--tRNA ligase [Candidatus Paceibacterota bacterium]